jgi:HAD superfamily hydrolase (TIGR01509 family)
MIKALIFDFDGLILDTETPLIAVWKAIYAEHGFDYPMEKWSQTVGGWGASTFDPGAHLHKLTGSTLNLDAVRARHEEQCNALILKEPVMPGVVDYVLQAPGLGLRLAVASSSERTWVEPHLARLGLKDRFEKIICGDDIEPGRTKPYPDVYLKALSEMCIGPDEAVVLEDSPNGLRAAKAAGIFVVLVPNPTTSQLPMDGADITLKSLADLPLQELLARAMK